MAGGRRSPFGAILRAYRLERGLSQVGLADVVTRRGADDPAVAELGLVSDKTIANLERLCGSPDSFVRPRPQTVRILATALDLSPGSKEERVFLDAAEETRARIPERKRRKRRGERSLFVRDGREEQLARLQDAWRLSSEGEPQVILLSGDAGAGKTELIRELCMEIQREDAYARVAWGECTHGALAVDPYLPMFQAMNMLLGLVTREDDPAIPSAVLAARQASTIDALLGIVPTLVGSLVDEQGLAEHVSRLEGDHPGLGDKLQRALEARAFTEPAGRLDQLVRFLATCATTSPILLVLEDLHWASDQIVAMLLHLHRQLRGRHGVHLLIIGSWRPGDLVDPDPSVRHPLAPALNELQRLDSDIVVDLGVSIGSSRGEAFVRGLLREVDTVSDEEKERFARFLFDRTEGHPMFAVELLRWLRETGRIGNGAAQALHIDFSALDVAAPVRIQSVIAERLERLPPRWRNVLEAAAVQGPVVTIELIPERGDLTSEEIATAVEEHLSPRFRLLTPAGTVTVAGKRLHRYQFRHALFQHYLYDTLAPSRRERLHARTAENMVSLLGGEPHAASGAIAYHFAQAYRIEEAAEHTHQAGVYALRQLNYEVAASWFRRVEEYADQVNGDRQVLAARNGLVSALRGMGRVDEAVRLGSRTLAGHQAHGYRDLEAEVADLLGQVHYDRSQLHDAISYLEMAATIHRELGQHAETSGSESMLSHACYRLGAYDDALRHARAAWESVQDLDHQAFAAEALLAVGNCEADLGMYGTALETYAHARALYTRSHEIRGELICNLNSGLCYIQLGRWDDALHTLRLARRRIAALQAPRMQGNVCHYLGFACEGAGELDAALEALNEAYVIRDRIGECKIADTIAVLLRIALVRRDDATARRHLDALEQWLTSSDGEAIEDPIGAWLTVARAHETLGSPPEVEQALHNGHTLLMKRAALITNPDARESYLTSVPANRLVLKEYARIAVKTRGD